MRQRKAIAIFIFLLGLGVILYPPFSKMYYDQQVRENVEEILKDLENQSTAIYQQQLDYNQSAISNPNGIEVADVSYVEEEPPETSVQAVAVEEGVLGTLHIPKINLVYPIYDGATHENLLNGVARIEGTSYPVGGINTNSVIAGHSSMAQRIFFTKITELIQGDLIYIRNAKEVLTYEVYATAVIEPNDTAALAVIPGQDTITLLTCTWPPPGNQRYLVYARRVADQHSKSVVSN